MYVLGGWRTRGTAKRAPVCGCRPSLDAVLELLGLLLPVLREVDRPLHDHIQATGVPPFFSLSWYITWFAHNLVRLGDAARLFDLFLGSHPIMPIYAAAAVLVVSPLTCSFSSI